MADLEQFFLTHPEDLSSYNYLDDSEQLRAKAYNNYTGRTFIDFEDNTSIRSDYTRRDYEYFRPALSNLTFEKKAKACQKAYEKVSIVHNIIDIMGDLTAQGIRIEHRDKGKERLFQAWFKYVNGPFVSERFANMLYRLANVPILTAYGKVNLPDEEELSKSTGGIHDTELKRLDIKTKHIPLRYSFVNPTDVELIGGNATLFLGQPYYALKLSSDLRSDLSKLSSLNNKILIKKYNEISKNLKSAIEQNSQFIEIDQDKFDIYYYKKDDWQLWANPMIACILDDLFMLEKLRLADLSALDGAISNIRHWRVGIIDPSNPKNSILPTKVTINKVRTILAKSVGGGTMDLVTGPEVDFKESNTQVHRFLGSEKYRTTLDAIYDGLGVPPPLRSGASPTNSTNNYVSLKTLTERLEYGRSILVKFWEKQISIVQKALKIKYPAKIAFEQTVLSDETAEKTLLLQLLDRDIISSESVIRYFGFIPEIEKVKTMRDYKSRKEGRVPPKASQFHNAEQDHDLKKIALQSGVAAPSEVGLELDEKKDGEESLLKLNIKSQEKMKKFEPKGSAGRPANIKETKKRKKKPNQKPRTSAELIIWATKAYNKIHDILSPALLDAYGKNNYRKLTKTEACEAEQIKFGILAQLEDFEDITPELVNTYIKIDSPISNTISAIAERLRIKFIKENEREPTLDEARQIQVLSVVENILDNF